MAPDAEPQVTIRAATVDDAEAIARLHIESWQWAYEGMLPDAMLDRLPQLLPRRTEYWRDLIADPPLRELIWVATLGQRVVGFASTGPSRDDDLDVTTGELFTIYLARDVAGQGIGRRLLERAMRGMREQGYTQAALWVLRDNERARRFYERSGWRPDGATKDERGPDYVLHEVRYRVDLTSLATSEP